jgi:hypothetical protein
VILPRNITRNYNSPRVSIVPIVLMTPESTIPERTPPVSPVSTLVIPLRFPPVPVSSMIPDPSPSPEPEQTNPREYDCCIDSITRLVYRIHSWIANTVSVIQTVNGFPKMKRMVLLKDHDDIDPISLEPLKKGASVIHFDCSHIVSEVSFRRLIASGQSRCPLCRNPFETSSVGGGDGSGSDEGSENGSDDDPGVGESS